MSSCAQPNLGHFDADTGQKTFLLGTLFLYAFFFPAFYNMLGTAGAILVNAGIILVVLVSALLLRQELLLRSSDARFLAVVALICTVKVAHISVLVYLGVAVYGVDFQLRDYYELHRPVFYFLCVATPFLLIDHADHIRKLQVVFFFIFAGVLCFLLVAFTPGGDYLLALYTKPHNIQSGRISAPFINPYDYAFVVSLFSFWFLLRALKGQYRYVLALMLSVILIVSTQSRSVIGGYLVGMIAVPVLLVLYYSEELRRYLVPRSLFRLLAGLLLVFLAMLLLFQTVSEYLPYLISGFQRVFLEGETGPYATRVDQMVYAIERAETWPVMLLGNGPAKSVMEYLESIYTYMFFRYGFLGFLFYFLVPYLFALTLFWTLAKKHKHGESGDFYLAIFIWMVMILPASLGNNLTEQARSMFLYYFLIGFAWRAYSITMRDAPAQSGTAVSGGRRASSAGSARI